MIGQPGDTRKSVLKTIKFAKELDLDYAQFTRTIAKPGAKLYEKVKEIMGYDYFSKYILGEVEEMRLPNPWTELTEKEIETLTRKAYLQLYLRPKFVLRKIIELKSFEELIRYAKVGMEMILSKSIFKRGRKIY